MVNQTCIKQLFDISVVSPVGQLYQRPKDCAQVLLNGETTSGLYTVYIGGEESQPVQVYCDMSTDGGGWMVSESKPAGRLSLEALQPYFTSDMSYTGPVFPLTDCRLQGLQSLIASLTQIILPAGFSPTAEWKAGLLQELEELHSRLWQHE